MVERLSEELFVDSRLYRFHPEPGHPNRAIVEGGKCFELQLSRNSVTFGDTQINQWWMPRTTLFPDRKRPAQNYRVIVEYFWAQCWKENSVLDDNIQEVYILANLFPYVRGTAAQDIFRDAAPGKGKLGVKQRKMIQELDKVLRSSRENEMDAKELHYHTGSVLGPRRFTLEEWNWYREIVDELLGQGRKALERWGKPGLQIPLKTWQDWMSKISRRKGNYDRKLILDVLSVEIRAAFFQCYGAVWCALLPHLADKYEMSDEEVLFHKLWHLPYRTESEESPKLDFHAFHGCPFSLHPAVDNFTQTATGGTLIHNWLSDPGNDSALWRLFNGICLTTFHYVDQLDDYAQLRKKDGDSSTVSYSVALEERLVEKQAGRRRKNRRGTDAL